MQKMYYAIGALALLVVAVIVLIVIRVNRRESIVDDDYPYD